MDTWLPKQTNIWIFGCNLQPLVHVVLIGMLKYHKAQPEHRFTMKATQSSMGTGSVCLVYPVINGLLKMKKHLPTNTDNLPQIFIGESFADQMLLFAAALFLIA